MERIVIGSDHGGFDMKEELKKRLENEGYSVLDAGCFSREMTDYPVWAKAVSEEYLKGDCKCGIIICGTGIGVSIAANKIKGIRAAHIADSFSARMAKEHNDANIITLGARTLGIELAWECVKSYLKAEFQGGIHAPRVEMLNSML